MPAVAQMPISTQDHRSPPPQPQSHHAGSAGPPPTVHLRTEAEARAELIREIERAVVDAGAERKWPTVKTALRLAKRSTRSYLPPGRYTEAEVAAAADAVIREAGGRTAAEAIGYKVTYAAMPLILVLLLATAPDLVNGVGTFIGLLVATFIVSSGVVGIPVMLVRWGLQVAGRPLGGGRRSYLVQAATALVMVAVFAGVLYVRFWSYGVGWFA